MYIIYIYTYTHITMRLGKTGARRGGPEERTALRGTCETDAHRDRAREKACALPPPFHNVELGCDRAASLNEIGCFFCTALHMERQARLQGQPTMCLPLCFDSAVYPIWLQIISSLGQVSLTR